MLRRALWSIVLVGAIAACSDNTALVNAPATPSTDVCAVVSAQEVQRSFHVPDPLATFPMGESSGPACGYADPREGVGGWVFVIQFQEVERWADHAAKGVRVEGLGHDAVVSRNVSAELLVRDEARGKVLSFVAPSPPARTHEPLFDLAAGVYGVSREAVRLAV